VNKDYYNSDQSFSEAECLTSNKHFDFGTDPLKIGSGSRNFNGICYHYRREPLV